MMSEWGWVIFAYTITYGALIGYVTSLAWRIRIARRRLEETQ